jgi:hypothetical protein
MNYKKHEKCLYMCYIVNGFGTYICTFVFALFKTITLPQAFQTYAPQGNRVFSEWPENSLELHIVKDGVVVKLFSSIHSYRHPSMDGIIQARNPGRNK